MQAPDSKPQYPEVLFVNPGNQYGLLGHSALRLNGRIYDFWMVGTELILDSVREDCFFKLYSEYEERDIVGIEIAVTEQQLRAINDFLLREEGNPSSIRPYYNLLNNNCASGILHLLQAGLCKTGTDAPCITTMRNLADWTRENYPVLHERFYLSYRHKAMQDNAISGDARVRDFVVPLSNCDSHSYKCWRLVYTEDLRGKNILLRPIAGIGNIGAGAVQSVYGIVATPLGKMPEFFNGLGSIVIAIPELLGITVRKAGKAAPFDAKEITRIIQQWRPKKRAEHKSRP